MIKAVQRNLWAGVLVRVGRFGSLAPSSVACVVGANRTDSGLDSQEQSMYAPGNQVCYSYFSFHICCLYACLRKGGR
jgi:hypothetical protein